MNRTFLVVAAGLVVGGLFALSLYQQSFVTNETGGQPVSVLVAAVDIPLGQPVRDEWLMLRDIPESYVEDRHLLLESRREIIGLPLAETVHAGEAILRTDLSAFSTAQRTLSAAVPPGRRALTLPCTRTSTHNGLLRPGDRVDVLLNVGEFANPLAGRGVVLLQNVLVLAYGLEIRSETNGEGERATSVERSANVTLEVSVDQAGIIAQARNQGGSLQLVLRNPNDGATSTVRIPDVVYDDIVDAVRRGRFLRRTARGATVPPPPPG